jgi:hypothetical protein
MRVDLNINFRSVAKVEDMFPGKPVTITDKMRQFLEVVPYADSKCTGVDIYKSYLEKYKSLKYETLDELVGQIASNLALHASRRISNGVRSQYTILINFCRLDMDGEEVNLVQPESSVDHLTGLLLTLFVAPGHCIMYVI